MYEFSRVQILRLQRMATKRAATAECQLCAESPVWAVVGDVVTMPLENQSYPRKHLGS